MKEVESWVMTVVGGVVKGVWSLKLRGWGSWCGRDGREMYVRKIIVD